MCIEVQVIFRPDFLSVDLRDFCSDLGSGGGEKTLKMTSFLLISPEQTVKLY